MKPSTTTTTGVVVFSGLVAVAAADALPMDSIPLSCVKVCGPIVELTSICNTNVDARRRALKRRKVEPAGARGPRLHYAARVPEEEEDDDEEDEEEEDQQHCSGGRCKKANIDAERRQFSIIRQAPTSFPPELLNQPEQTFAARPTRIFPIVQTTATAISTSLVPPPPPTNASKGKGGAADEGDGGDGLSAQPESSRPAPSTSLSLAATTLPGSASVVMDAAPTSTTTSSSTTTTTTMTSNPGAGTGKQNDRWTPNDAEQQCVCLNQSFDVGMLTALCASCVDQTGDTTNNINTIVQTCNFKPQTYTRDSDRAAENVRVKAKKPALQMVVNGNTSGALAQESGTNRVAGVASRAAVAVVVGGVAAWVWSW